jgi:hypothetical protein
MLELELLEDILFEAKRGAVNSEPSILKAVDVFMLKCAFFCMELTDLKDCTCNCCTCMTWQCILHLLWEFVVDV